MSRHLADHTRATTGARIRQFLKIDHRDGHADLHPALAKLFRRARHLDSGAKLKAFLKIERDTAS